VVVPTADDRAHHRAPHVYVRCGRCGQRSWRRQGDDRPWRPWQGKFPVDAVFGLAARPAPRPARRSGVAGRLLRWRPSRRVRVGV
jgi:hypothetical protein